MVSIFTWLVTFLPCIAWRKLFGWFIPTVQKLHQFGVVWFPGALFTAWSAGLQSCSVPNREEIVLPNQWKSLSYGHVSRIQNFLFSGSILQLGTCLGDCSAIPLTGSPAPWKNLATDSSSDEFDDSSCSQCSIGARHYKLHLIFSSKTIPKFLPSLLSLC